MWLPAVSDKVVTVATPLVTVTVPSVVAPSVNVTVLVTALGRVAVKVTDWLTEDGLAEEVRAIDGVCLTV